jgi:hypothetical protein
MEQPQRTHCDNCQTELAGEFCFECGQAARAYDVPITTFAKDMVSESLDLDSRLRTTMRPLFFRPGLVPRDYVAGHRARFVPPFRLYLLASFAMFLLMSFGSGIDVRGGEGAQFTVDLTVGDDDEVAELAAEAAEAAAEPGKAESAATPAASQEGSDTPLTETTEERLERWEELIETRLAEGFQEAAADPGAFAEEFSSRMAQAMFFLLPIFALLLKGMYRKRLYIHHIVFAIYFHAWFFLVVAVTLIPGVIGFPRIGDVMAILLLWAPFYLVFAMRRFYGQSSLRTFLKLFVLSNAYLLFASVTMLGVILWTIASD